MNNVRRHKRVFNYFVCNKNVIHKIKILMFHDRLNFIKKHKHVHTVHAISL